MEEKQIAEQIKVIDSMCGMGKTSWAIQYINEHPDKSFIYVAPFLSEIDRIKENTSVNFVEPEFKNGGRKLDDFNRLLCNGTNIATTHSTFLNSDDNTLNLLQQGNYTLILDEVITVITQYNDIAEFNAKIRGGDINLLIDKSLIAVDEYCRVSWTGPSYDNGEYIYAEIERLAKRHNLLLIDGKLFLVEFPVDVFKSFNEVYILTYMFNGSQLCPFFNYYDLNYVKLNVVKQDTKYALVPFKHDADTALYKSLITLNRDETLNQYDKRTMLSSNWYDANIKAKSSETTRMRNNLHNFLRNKCNAKSKQIMWTCPKKHMSKLRVDGCREIRALTGIERKLPDRQQKKLREQLSCFVSCNAKATNDFRERNVLAYCCNLFINPNIKKFFEKKNVRFDEDAFALGSLIQWVWRSAIRDGKPINLYIPASRVRKLFDDWLRGKLPEGCY